MYHPVANWRPLRGAGAFSIDERPAHLPIIEGVAEFRERFEGIKPLLRPK